MAVRLQSATRQIIIDEAHSPFVDIGSQAIRLYSLLRAVGAGDDMICQLHHR